ncbi:hypothetical protein I6F14_23205 [Bradyrhizobium sp. IC3069]|uniref:hypothetical protein n=1 Tax=Bradyrhizobium sp. IC3069 TaxID=2793806 RepID=UPI001CD1ABD8|nr:hypothetical protein [Bradyrhizobium sp. IC3069]MCA1520884.1 hypothetical protein [Bradyrhizobium sp. IC3069]
MIEAVAERLEGAPRQLRQEALEPGASVSGIAHRIGFTRRSTSPGVDARAERIYPSRASSCEAAVACMSVIEIYMGKVVVRASGDVDEAHLQRVIRAARSA